MKSSGLLIAGIVLGVHASSLLIKAKELAYQEQHVGSESQRFAYQRQKACISTSSRLFFKSSRMGMQISRLLMKIKELACPLKGDGYSGQRLAYENQGASLSLAAG